MHEYEVSDGLRLDRVVVSINDPDIFLYAGTGDSAHSMCELVRGVLGEHSIRATVAIDFWHPVHQEWETADDPASGGTVGDAAPPSKAVPDDAELATLEQEHQAAVKHAQAISTDAYC
ncbi:MAG TPA: hypothetical protein VMU95_29620 [Trebonia sp.]|nr:hypothetical protein [Trebonia sp.]